MSRARRRIDSAPPEALLDTLADPVDRPRDAGITCAALDGTLLHVADDEQLT
ncbi:hypothetical protein [Streptomyces albipurpureus]|uniref:Uncharacterized protein n=1 Tax=Streptomyces albipurpureus TaxID=2897419 RepID=A0ABT0UMX8_9ACTN|nr:hypothetical protein [Streptomyces sp. CWNU-1]MCM2389435.1 hypothetical protein [Streptomyces sp. CWNU-1]